MEETTEPSPPPLWRRLPLSSPLSDELSWDNAFFGRECRRAGRRRECCGTHDGATRVVPVLLAFFLLGSFVGHV